MTNLWARLRDRRRRRTFAHQYAQTTVAFQVRLLRLSRAMSRAEMASEAGISSRVLRRIENPDDEGDYELGALTNIAAVFDVALIARLVPFSQAAAQVADDAPPTFDQEAAATVAPESAVAGEITEAAAPAPSAGEKE